MAIHLSSLIGSEAARSRISRRKFLAVGTGVFLCSRTRAALEDSERLHRISRSSHALGTTVSLSVLHKNRTDGSAALDAAFGELERVEQLMSIYRTDSQLCALNRDRFVTSPDPLLVEILKCAVDWSVRSGGAFDVTVQPLWELFQNSKDRGVVPNAMEIEVAREKVGWQRLDVSSSVIRLRGDGTAVTLNGIAQGFATDRVNAVLREHGIEHALIDCGEIGAVGTNEAGKPWRIGIQHPREADAFVSIAELEGRSMATSGDYATPFTPDFRLNHLFDPRTGRSPEELASVTIIAPTATEADALSTAVFVMGLEAGMSLVEKQAKTDAFMMLKNGNTFATKGFPWRT